jgi:hypothetical protein
MSRFALIAAAACLVMSCKKEQPAGMAPSSDWQATQQGSAQPGAEPHGGGQGDGAGNPHGGVGSAQMPNDSIHGGMGSGNPHGGSASAHGGGQGPMVADATPKTTAPATLEKLPDGRHVLGPFTLVAPKEWTIKPVTSSMRAAHFELSAKPGEEAELVVYFFGASGAGGVQANVDRWLGQFAQADGKPSKDVAKIEQTKIAGMDATTVSVAGHFTTTQMPGGPPPIDMPDGALLAAIVTSPSGPYYFKLTGRKKTVDANAARFKTMLASMKIK